MISPGRYAFGNARVRARKAGLLGPDAAARLRAARDPAALARIREELGAAPDARSWARLGDDYRVVLRSFPVGGALVLALFRRHEAENVKLALRAVARGSTSAPWAHLWRPLGRLESVRREQVQEARSMRELKDVLARTPWAEIVPAAGLDDGEALGALELSIDRRVSQAILAGADELPAREREAAELGRAVVRERDAELVFRAEAYGLTAELARAQAVLGARRGEGADLPRLELRRHRRRACRRAFVGSPFRLGPAIAFLLLREEELRGLWALTEAWGDPASAGALEEALAAGALGD